MKKFFLEKARRYLEKNNYSVIHESIYRSDMESEFLEIWKKVTPYTMISMERGYNIYKSVEYIVKNKISGNFIECGVWKGGACMLMTLSLLAFEDKIERKLYLYDTFSGMTEPSENDKVAFSGKEMLKRWKESRDEKKRTSLWAASLEEVKKNILTVGYPETLVEYCKGDVCHTLDIKVPEKIALLRLDTDWYESTKKELEILFPKLEKGGILIIDDYGHFTGAKKAVDEYFDCRKPDSEKNKGIFLGRIDYTGRVSVKL